MKDLGTVVIGGTLAASQDDSILPTDSHVQLNMVSKLVQLYHTSGSAPLGSA